MEQRLNRDGTETDQKLMEIRNRDGQKDKTETDGKTELFRRTETDGETEQRRLEKRRRAGMKNCGTGQEIRKLRE